jgi:hypothetical protein
VRERPQIVADGLPADSYDLKNTGKHLHAEEWHAAMERKDAILIDMRNRYETYRSDLSFQLFPASLSLSLCFSISFFAYLCPDSHFWQRNRSLRKRHPVFYHGAFCIIVMRNNHFLLCHTRLVSAFPRVSM